MTGSRRADLLWSTRQQIVGGVLILLGLVLLTVCWWGVSGERTFEAQKDWLVGACLSAGVTLAGLAYLFHVGTRALRGLKDDVRTRTLRLTH